jgi:hypothetical protein
MGQFESGMLRLVLQSVSLPRPPGIITILIWTVWVEQDTPTIHLLLVTRRGLDGSCVSAPRTLVWLRDSIRDWVFVRPTSRAFMLTASAQWCHIIYQRYFQLRNIFPGLGQITIATVSLRPIAPLRTSSHLTTSRRNLS